MYLPRTINFLLFAGTLLQANRRLSFAKNETAMADSSRSHVAGVEIILAENL
jgi:hypothetical protein